jgi:Protein of unknown function (DUF5818)
VGNVGQLMNRAQGAELFEMSNGSRLRLTGTLSKRRRGFLLTCDDGQVWTVNLADNLLPPIGQRLILEGLQAGVDRVDVDWFGPVS